MWWIIGLLVLAVIVVAAGTFAAGTVRRKTFGTRCDGNPRIKYFTHRDFPGLDMEPVSFPAVDGTKLRGGLYVRRPVSECRGLVVFVHGMGGGHLSYTTEIDRFAQMGFAVLAYDNTGTMESEGTSLVGMHRAVEDLGAALGYCERRCDLAALPLLLAGHSWGGFAVGCGLALPEARRVKGAVIFSGFATYAGIVAHTARIKTGKPMGWLKPFARLDELLTFGSLGGWSVCSGMRKSAAPILAIHGALDDTVPVELSAAMAAQRSSRPHTRGVIVPGKYHNPYNTQQAEELLRGFLGEREALHAASPSPEELDRFYRQVDFKGMTEEDDAVLELTERFFDQCLKEEPHNG